MLLYYGRHNGFLTWRFYSYVCPNLRQFLHQVAGHVVLLPRIVSVVYTGSS